MLVLDPVFLLPPNLHLTVAQGVGDAPQEGERSSRAANRAATDGAGWHFMVDTQAQSTRLSVRGFGTVPVSCTVATPPARLGVSTAEGAPVGEGLAGHH